MDRGRQLGATHFLNVSDYHTHERYPVYVYPTDNLRKIKQQFKSVNFSIIEVDYDQTTI